ncbi:MAG: hypothetical protein ACKOEE_08090, partial [Tagaea sp.]
MLDRRALLAGLALLTAPARAQTRPSLFGPHPDYEALGLFDRMMADGVARAMEARRLPGVAIEQAQR